MTAKAKSATRTSARKLFENCAQVLEAMALDEVDTLKADEDAEDKPEPLFDPTMPDDELFDGAGPAIQVTGTK